MTIGKDEDMAAFVQTYDQGIADDNDELDFLSRETQDEHMDAAEEEPLAEENVEPAPIITAAEARKALREMAEGERVGRILIPVF
jgi:hypothetical protein